MSADSSLNRRHFGARPQLRKDYSHRGAELPGGGMKWSDPSLIAGDNPRQKIYSFSHGIKLRGVRFASVEELPHERITVHLLEQLQLLTKPRQSDDTKLLPGYLCLAPTWIQARDPGAVSTR